MGVLDGIPILMTGMEKSLMRDNVTFVVLILNQMSSLLSPYSNYLLVLVIRLVMST